MTSIDWALLVLFAAAVAACALIGWLTLLPILKARAMLRAEPLPSLKVNVEPARHPSEGKAPLNPVAAVSEARLSLVAAEALLADALRTSLLDLFGLSFERGRAKQSSLGAAARHMRSAQQLIQDAQRHRSLQIAAPEPIEFDSSPTLNHLETSWLGDGFALDFAVHRRIKKAREQAARMLEHAELLIRALEAAGASVKPTMAREKRNTAPYNECP